MKNVYTIGLAGGIGSGKSTVAEVFGRLGAVVLNADVMVHELLREPGTVRKVAGRFGKEILDGRGRIDRKKLAARAFRSEKAIRDLEKLLHPAVIRKTKARLRQAATFCELRRPRRVTRPTPARRRRQSRPCRRTSSRPTSTCTCS